MTIKVEENNDHPEDNCANEGPMFETKFDVALHKAGSWGRWQIWMVIIISASQIFGAIHGVSAVFLSANFDYRCDQQINSTNPVVVNLINRITNYSLQSSECTIFNHNYSAIESLVQSTPENELSELSFIPYLSNESVPCDRWIYESDYQHTSAVSEWDLVCARKILRSTVQATYMGGILVGSALFGQLSDSIGRRKTMVTCSFLLLIVSISVGFAESYIMFLILRFCVALLAAGLMVINFVLVMEITKPEVRSFTGMLNGIPFGMGIALLPCFAYFFREWRTLQFALGSFGGILLTYYWILPESPRWLVSKGRPHEALEILKTIAKWNKKVLPSDEEMLILLTESTGKENMNKSNCNKCSSLCDDHTTLIRTPVMRKRCLISFFAWFVASMVYYGLIFSGPNIEANLYLMVLVSGLVEIPSFIVTALLLHRFGRRLISCSLFIVSSIMLLIIIGIPKEQKLATFILTNMGQFFNTAVFQLCYLYTSELMPTGVRNVAVGTSSMVARIGSSIAPYVVDLLGEIHFSLPSAVFGALSLAAGLLSLLLPETLNKSLPQTVEEVEAKAK